MLPRNGVVVAKRSAKKSPAPLDHEQTGHVSGPLCHALTQPRPCAAPRFWRTPLPVDRRLQEMANRPPSSAEAKVYRLSRAEPTPRLLHASLTLHSPPAPARHAAGWLLSQVPRGPATACTARDRALACRVFADAASRTANQRRESRWPVAAVSALPF